ncbi:MAG TPA: hypothetical protein DCM08_00135 [Microscillaceae bacterium]|jgi:serine phosphatase RsbU (regulator of sigma subunit)|nr:hypothetical protein [Microscillaceae bacterium]
MKCYCIAILGWFGLLIFPNNHLLAQNTASTKVLVLKQGQSVNTYRHLNAYLEVAEEFSPPPTSLRQVEQLSFKSLSELQSSLTYSKFYWAKLKLASDSPHPTKWILYPNEVSLDVLGNYYATLYLPYQDSLWVTQPGGVMLPQSQKTLKEVAPCFEIELQPNQVKTVYIRTQRGNFNGDVFNLCVYEKETWLVREKAGANLIQGIFQGILLIIMVYTLALYAIIRDKIYLYYCYYVFTINLVFLYIYGFLVKYIHPEFPGWNGYTWSFIHASINISFFLFLRRVIESEDPIDFLVRTLKISTTTLIFIFFGYILVFGITQDFNYIDFLSNSIVGPLSLVVNLFVNVMVFRKIRTKTTSTIIFGNVLLVLCIMGGVLLNAVYERVEGIYLMQLGVVVQIVFFGIALGLINLRKERERLAAQARIIEVQQEANETLEQKVVERTFQLQEANEEISSQRDAIAQKNKAITESIAYAQRIQQALLPSTEEIKAILPDSFVFYKPRDVVSGDFYWFWSNTQLSVITAIDCTGHGVPGALMSMIADSLITQIVLDNEIFEPDQILNELKRGVEKTFKQKESRDGMDIALCTIDHQRKILHFAGAKSSLLYIQEGCLHEIQGDKIAIGGTSLAEKKLFEKRELSFEKSTHIYLFTDGYIDQFGGPNDRKFMRKNFKELLLKHYHLPFAEQESAICKAIDTWMGDKAQTDDILVIGFAL